MLPTTYRRVTGASAVKEFPDVILWSIPAFLLLIVLERISYVLHRDDDEVGYGGPDTVDQPGDGAGQPRFRPAVEGADRRRRTRSLYALTPLRVTELWWTWPLLLLAQDFFYYWSHRCHHMIRLLWASHVVHHSSQRFNLSTALRQPWTGVTSWVFYLPLIAARRAPGGARVLPVGQPALPVLDPHRADRQDAAAGSRPCSTPRRTTGCTTPRRAATSTATSAAS